MEIFRAISVLHQGRPWSSFAKRPPSLAGDLGSWKTSSKTAASCALSVVTDQCHRMSSDTNLIFLHFTFSLLHQILASLHFPYIPKPQLLHQIELVLLEFLIQKALLSAIWIIILSLVTLLFSFDKSAIKDELVPSWSIDGDITRGQSGALRANKMIIY